MTERITTHPLNTVADIEAAMRNGNVCLANDTQRDMSIGRREYWDHRSYPNTLHHWTDDEFYRFLIDQRFPPNTFRDRMVCRVQAIRRALASGKYVPEVVLSEESGQEALNDALMDIRASIAANAKQRDQDANVALFERESGFATSDTLFNTTLKKIFVAAAKSNGRNCDSGIFRTLSEIKTIKIDGLSQELKICLRTPNEYNSQTGKLLWIEIRDARYNDTSLYGTLMKIIFPRAETLFRQLIDEGAVSLEETRTLMGANWKPYSLVASISSNNSII